MTSATRRAASPRVSATVKARPDAARMRRPASAFVPCMRTMIGTLTPASFAAATTPSARRSQRRMPPKMLTRMARTLGSDRMIRNPAAIFAAPAPPPTSRKLAGSPPACLIRSMVAMASPAPFTMTPTFPSRRM